ncbi:MAG: energy transducer TonB [Acidobacteriota bacterium]
MQDNALFVSMNLERTSLLKRLFEEFNEAVSELRESPKAFIIGAIKGEGIGGRRRLMFLQYGLAISLLVYSTGFLLTLTLWTIRQNSPVSKDENPKYTIWLPSIGSAPPEANLRKGDDDQASHGGGGGGDNSPNPASFGERPDYSEEQPIIAPTTRPTLRPPAIPLAERLLGDPNLNVKRDDLLPTGLPNGVVSPPSDGQGKGNGIGTGNKGGVGPGNGPGFGPGEGGNQGDNRYTIGTRKDNRDRDENSEAVDVKPIALNRPRPNYTEQARQNKVQGLARARVLVGADGSVKQVRIVRGLPDGLSEEAIRAAYQMRFRPAMRNGQPVAYWVVVDIEFNIR